jgi:hypothetical protein
MTVRRFAATLGSIVQVGLGVGGDVVGCGSGASSILSPAKQPTISPN